MLVEGPNGLEESSKSTGALAAEHITGVSGMTWGCGVLSDAEFEEWMGNDVSSGTMWGVSGIGVGVGVGSDAYISVGLGKGLTS